MKMDACSLLLSTTTILGDHDCLHCKNGCCELNPTVMLSPTGGQSGGWIGRDSWNGFVASQGHVTMACELLTDVLLGRTSSSRRVRNIFDELIGRRSWVTIEDLQLLDLFLSRLCSAQLYALSDGPVNFFQKKLKDLVKTTSIHVILQQ